MSPQEILAFVHAHPLAIVATVSDDNVPEAALVGIAVMPDARIIFDTLKGSRKYSNLRHQDRVALVVGWEHEITVQLEGCAREPHGVDLERCKDAYFAVFPNGREREAWPDIAYIAVRVTWMRYSDYNGGGAGIIEHSC
jgi:pyridoxine/pyridoxamine 5'-phosphate oxidase